MNSITDGECGTLNYNPNLKKYEVKTDGGYGGTSCKIVKEEIIKAIKYDDRIGIISAYVFSRCEDDNYYKDYKYTTKVSISNENIETTDFIIQNKDKLEQYTYTFMEDENGFYYYTGFEKTNK